jgi:hypothetical protein
MNLRREKKWFAKPFKIEKLLVTRDVGSERHVYLSGEKIAYLQRKDTNPKGVILALGTLRFLNTKI